MDGPMNIYDFVHNVHTQQFKSGDIIFSHGDQCNGKMYFIFTGELAVIKVRDKIEHEVRRMHSGEFFGEMALISSEPRAATVRVTSHDTKLGVIDEDIFYKLAKISPEFLFALLKAAITRMVELDNELDEARCRDCQP
jgi:CRP/FNR family transcriptional regulator, cyclic AMP receptor protein